MSKLPGIILSFLILSGCKPKTLLVADEQVNQQLPFLTAAKVQVISYPNRRLWDSLERYNRIVLDGLLNFDQEKIKESKFLTEPQKQKAFDILYNMKCEGDMAAACYDPRHAFIFFDLKGNPSTYLEVCFECSNYNIGNGFDLNTSCPEKWGKLYALVKEAGIKYDGEGE